MPNLFIKSRLFFFIFLVVLGIGSARIISTYQVFNNTTDEPYHIVCGLEWIDLGSFNYETKHPPLSRVMNAVGPYFDGTRIPEHRKEFLKKVTKKRSEQGILHLKYDWDTLKSDWNAINAMMQDGQQILYGGGTYFRTLALARMGTLPFFILASLIVWFWARKLFDEITGLVAVVLFSTLPVVLAHSGLATTDMAITASMLGFVFAYSGWSDRPTLKRSFILGAAGAVAILSKLTAFLLIPVCIFAHLIFKWKFASRTFETKILFKRRSLALVFSIVIGLSFLWAGYRFSLSSFTSKEYRPHKVIDQAIGSKGVLHDFAYAIAEAPIIPAMELLGGIYQAKTHNKRGQKSYLLGKTSEKGWWYFFPVAFVVKTPIPFIIFTIVGLSVLFRNAMDKKLILFIEPGIFGISIILGCMFLGNINIGIRHILPAYPLFSIVAGFGAVYLWKLRNAKFFGRTITIFLLVWQLTMSFYVHPDYLAYFNEIGGRHPERILVDSDLDWGQDLHRLSIKLHELDIKKFAIAYSGWADLNRHGLPEFELLSPNERVTGWIAISIQKIKTIAGYSWIEEYQPVGLVGKSIRLYNIPEQALK